MIRRLTPRFLQNGIITVRPPKPFYLNQWARQPAILAETTLNAGFMRSTDSVDLDNEKIVGSMQLRHELRGSYKMWEIRFDGIDREERAAECRVVWRRVQTGTGVIVE
jgi:hypothetical protein